MPRPAAARGRATDAGTVVVMLRECAAGGAAFRLRDPGVGPPKVWKQLAYELNDLASDITQTREHMHPKSWDFSMSAPQRVRFF